jgi:uncharacterized iron-regulated membrane protein
MRYKKYINKIHLWLGIPSGLLVFIIAITGCLYAFHEEIQNITQPFRYVEIQNSNYLSPSRLIEVAQNQLPDKQLRSIKYNEKHQSVEAVFYHYTPSYYYSVFINPYNGNVLKIRDNDADFFRFVLKGHFYLWLPPKIGQPIVAYSTLIFIILLISGLILWFPKNWNVLKQSFLSIWKKSNNWKRKNYDLHRVLGFYASFIALFIALTGLVWGFQWFANGLYKGAGGDKSLIYSVPESMPDVNKWNNVTVLPVDYVFAKMMHEYPDFKTIELNVPDKDSLCIAASVNKEIGTRWKTDYRYFNQFTLNEVAVDHVYGRFSDARFADKLMRMNYDIHVGAIGGLAGKTLVFCISLLVASLPVTGFIIWLAKKKKKKK